MLDVLCIGELLVDFVALSAGKRIADGPSFAPAAGGAPANVAVGVRRLGLTSGFLGKVGDDGFGTFLEKTLVADGVDTSYLLRDKRAKTTLAFVSLDADGDRDFEFYRDPGADAELRPEELPLDFIQEAQVLHFGSVSLSREPARSATYCAVEFAHENGLLVSYDPNYRAPLWPNALTAVEEMRRALAFAHVVKVSEEELALIADGGDLAGRAGQLFDVNPSLRVVLVTLGCRGSLAINRQQELVEAEGFAVKTIDTTGAGDAFVAGFLSALLRLDADLRQGRVSGEQLKQCLRWANAAAALSTEKNGAIPSLPRAEEVQAFLASR